jgi:hypothetical protein
MNTVVANDSKEATHDALRRARALPLPADWALVDIEDLAQTLTGPQKDLLIGLGHGSPGAIAVLKARIPTGTRELLESHQAITAEGDLTAFGQHVADLLAFEAGDGPDPSIVARAERNHANVLSA